MWSIWAPHWWNSVPEPRLWPGGGCCQHHLPVCQSPSSLYCPSTFFCLECHVILSCCDAHGLVLVVQTGVLGAKSQLCLSEQYLCDGAGTPVSCMFFSFTWYPRMISSPRGYQTCWRFLKASSDKGWFLCAKCILHFQLRKISSFFKFSLC